MRPATRHIAPQWRLLQTRRAAPAGWSCRPAMRRTMPPGPGAGQNRQHPLKVGRVHRLELAQPRRRNHTDSSRFCFAPGPRPPGAHPKLRRPGERRRSRAPPPATGPRWVLRRWVRSEPWPAPPRGPPAVAGAHSPPIPALLRRSRTVSRAAPPGHSAPPSHARHPVPECVAPRAARSRHPSQARSTASGRCEIRGVLP